MRHPASRGAQHDPLGTGASVRLEYGRSARWDFFWHAHAACELIVMANGAEHPGPVAFRWRVGGAEGTAHHPAAFLVAPGLPHAFWTDGFLPNNQAIASSLAWWDPALTALPACAAWQGVGALLGRARRGVRFAGAAAAVAAERLAADPGVPARRAALIIDVLAILAADGGSDCNPADPLPVDARRDLERLAAVEALLVERYREPLTLPEVARRCGMSESTLNALLKRHHRATFLDVLNRVRVDRAKEGLMRSGGDITAVALACGFGSIATFNRRFRRHEGVSPQAWRERQR